MIRWIHKKGSDNINIKIIGSNCSIGRRLIKQMKNLSKIYHKDIYIEELNFNKDKLKYKVNMVPALIINEKIISQGKTLSNKEIKKLILNTSNS